MNMAIFAYSEQGCHMARKIAAVFQKENVDMFTVSRLWKDGFEEIKKPSDAFYGELFFRMDAMIFVGSCGIAVRQIAPHIKSKQTDPAVLVVDELGNHVIPLLSGHIGGANALAETIASALKSTAVITTATDINCRFSVDAWAARQGFVLGSMEAAKAVSAAILERDIPLMSDFPIRSPYPTGVFHGERGELGIYIGYRTKKPFTKTLQIIPPVLCLGIGCRRGTEADCIRRAVNQTLMENGIDYRGVRAVASIDLKAEEQGLHTFCREQNLPLNFYSAEELMAISGTFTASSFVQSVTGADNVCERAARMGTRQLIVKKTAAYGVTVAVASEDMEVSFE